VKAAVRSAVADSDIENAISHYVVEAAHVVDRFIDSLERAVAHIEKHPGTGSPRYAHELNIPQLRFWQLTSFPYALFYVEHDNHLDIVRLVHMSRDIPASLRDARD
jgi:toxin ParE1/3/4